MISISYHAYLSSLAVEFSFPDVWWWSRSPPFCRVHDHLVTKPKREIT
jgi:hypothetical protein